VTVGTVPSPQSGVLFAVSMGVEAHPVSVTDKTAMPEARYRFIAAAAPSTGERPT
jgi:hypothetical protein